jgi:hypothetical protein
MIIRSSASRFRAGWSPRPKRGLPDNQNGVMSESHHSFFMPNFYRLSSLNTICNLLDTLSFSKKIEGFLQCANEMELISNIKNK